MKEVNDILAEGTEAEAREPFTVDTMEKASWAIDKMAQAESEIQRIEKQYQLYLNKLNDWKEQAQKDYKETVEYMAEQVRPYCLQKVLQGGKNGKKSVPFLQGDVKFRKSESVVIDNEAQVMEWLENFTDGYIEKVVTFKYSKADLKNLIEDGALIPGCKVEKKDGFKVELKPIAVYLK